MTRKRTWSSLIWPPLAKSSRRPGVATTRLAFCNLAICIWYGMPPTTVAMRRPRQCLTRSMASAATCWASSRVGHSTKAPGTAGLKWRDSSGFLRRGRLGAGSPAASAAATLASHAAFSRAAASPCMPSSVCRTGSRKAAVLPLPVWLLTIRSLKSPSGAASASGMARCCTAVGSVKPRSATAACSSGAKPSAANGLLIATVSVAAGACGSSANGVFSSKEAIRSLVFPCAQRQRLVHGVGHDASDGAPMKDARVS